MTEAWGDGTKDSNIHSDEYTLKLFKSGSNVKRVVFYPSIFY